MTNVKDLQKNQLHIGGRTEAWNPKMKHFLCGQKNGVYVFDLEKTADLLEKTKKFLAAVKLKNGKVLFVGTKPQTALIFKEKLEKLGHFYVDQKWMPGLLTNFKEIRKRIDYYLNLKTQFESGEISKYTKKEVSQFKKELEKLNAIYHGVAEMRKKPEAVIVFDAVVDRLAIEEAGRAGVAVVAIVDSNANPDGVDFPIPANDDSVKSIRFLLEEMLQSVA